MRNGFVSNSSSSSFIIAYKDEESCKCPHCGRGDTNVEKLKNYFSCDYCDKNAWQDFDSMKDLLLEIEEYCYDEKYDKQIKEKVESLKENHKFAKIEISNHDIFLRDMFFDNKNIIIINQEEE